MFIPPVDFQFQSTPSVWRETRSRVKIILIRSISIHSLRVEGDTRAHWTRSQMSFDFNPLPPCGGRLCRCERSNDLFCHISIHSLRVEGDVDGVRDGKRQAISIHSLRVEGDSKTGGAVKIQHGFQSTPSVWRETGLSAVERRFYEFQSTPSVWRETNGFKALLPEYKFQSTPSVWRETLTESGTASDRRFQSTPSVWRETGDYKEVPQGQYISIHSLRVEGD